MNGVQPWMKLKVNADTFFLPDEDGAVYFRNNAGSFRMEGTSIQSWLEKLLPVFNGTESLWSLTDGLPAPYQERIYNIAGILYENGFVRDVSQDEPHQLSDHVLQYYAPQIEFVDNLIGSGAYHFQNYRNARIAVIGSGGALLSLVSTLLESGIKTVNLVAADDNYIDQARLQELIAFCQIHDGDVNVCHLSHEIKHSAQEAPQKHDVSQKHQAPQKHDVSPKQEAPPKHDASPIRDALRNIVRQMDAVIYFSEQGDVGTLHQVESICNEERKGFLPATFVNGVGLAGPLVWPNESNGPNGVNGQTQTTSAWDAAFRRIHQPVFENDLSVSGFTGTAGAVLANIITFELFKTVTGVSDEAAYNRFYTLNPETLEGTWHEFIPAPPVQMLSNIPVIKDLGKRLRSEHGGPDNGDLLAYFAQLTDTTSGIFHVWDEGALSQLPLPLCRVQPIDPLSKGPASLLAEMVCAGLTHEDARREAGLVGIEAYVKRIADMVKGSIRNEPGVSVGAGASLAEAVGRGLVHALAANLQRTLANQTLTIQAMELGEVKDEKIQFYMRALRDAGVELALGRSQDIFGFPIAWVGLGEMGVDGSGTDGNRAKDDHTSVDSAPQRFVSSVGLNLSMALQLALEHALCVVADPMQDITHTLGHVGMLPSMAVTVVMNEGDAGTDVDPWTGFHAAQVLEALASMAAGGYSVTLFDLSAEPFLTEVLAGVVGVSIRGGDSA